MTKVEKCKCRSLNDFKYIVKTKKSWTKNGFHNSALMLQATVPGWREMQEKLDLKM